MNPRIHVPTTDTPLTQPISIRVAGAVPSSLVTLQAETERNGAVWTAQATYWADAEGNVDLSHDAPVSGDYRNADAAGLLWSQRRSAPGSSPVEPADPTAPVQTTLTLRTEPGTGDYAGHGATHQVDSVTLRQHVLTDAVERIEVREGGLVGTLFRPSSRGSLPTVIVMNGSGGGVNEARAAAYAERGIQAFALGYFRAPGLSPYISRTPLEYFERALDYVEANLAVAGRGVVVSGQSRGGELSLLLGALYPDRVGGIAAFVPGAFVFGAQGAADPQDGWDGPTWTRSGEPLEHFWHSNKGVTWQPWSDVPAPTRHRDVYVDGLRDRELARASRIPIERFRGPVACVSGLDDRAWPSSLASRMVMRSLEQSGHTAERLHLDYEDAGHGISLPNLPTTEIERVHPVSGVHYSNGGTPRGNAFASADSFEKIAEFIHRVAE